jgi:hypothetical protein
MIRINNQLSLRILYTFICQITYTRRQRIFLPHHWCSSRIRRISDIYATRTFITVLTTARKFTLAYDTRTHFTTTYYWFQYSYDIVFPTAPNFSAVVTLSFQLLPISVQLWHCLSNCSQFQYSCDIVFPTAPNFSTVMTLSFQLLPISVQLWYCLSNCSQFTSWCFPTKFPCITILRVSNKRQPTLRDSLL